MTLDDLKKIAAAAAIGGGLVFGITNDKNCPHTVDFEGKKECLTEVQKQILESQLPVSQGFGGLRFGGK